MVFFPIDPLPPQKSMFCIFDLTLTIMDGPLGDHLMFYIAI